MASTEIVGQVMNKAKEYHARSLISSFHYMVTHYSIGDAGHDPSNPVLALSPDPESEVADANGGRPPLYGPDVFDGAVVQAPYCAAFQCSMDRHEAVGPISQIALWATVTSNPGFSDLPSVGEQFLFALSNRPLFVKTNNEPYTQWVTTRW